MYFTVTDCETVAGLRQFDRKTCTFKLDGILPDGTDAPLSRIIIHKAYVSILLDEHGNEYAKITAFNSSVDFE